MRKFKVISASLVAASSFGFAACGDDPEPGETDTAIETSPETTPDTTPETTPDAETTPDGDIIANPCEGITCGAKPSTCNAEGAVVSYGAGTCDEGACVYTETTSACTGTDVCNAGACVGEGNACEYEFNKRISYVTSIEIAPASPPSEACCFDFNGDSTKDNKLGSVLALVKTFAGDSFDVNQILADQIADGGLVLLLEAKNVGDVANASGVTLNGFYGADGDADTTNNTSGTAEFLVNPSSFVEGTSAPLISFGGASIVSSVLNAGPSVFALSIPVLGASLDLKVDGTRVEGTVGAGLDGADGGLKIGDPVGASLGGYVATKNVASAFNTYLDASCSCIAKIDTAKPYVGTEVKSGAEQLTLNIGKGDDCTEESESTCASIAEYIGQGGLASTLIGPALAPDVDGDDDGLKESISLGVRIKATSARVKGVDGCTP